MFYFYTAIFCILTGMILIVGPIAVGLFFSPEGLTKMAGGSAGALGMYLV
jgi:hypothetical protein